MEQFMKWKAVDENHQRRWKARHEILTLLVSPTKEWAIQIVGSSSLSLDTPKSDFDFVIIGRCPTKNPENGIDEFRQKQENSIDECKQKQENSIDECKQKPTNIIDEFKQKLAKYQVTYIPGFVPILTFVYNKFQVDLQFLILNKPRLIPLKVLNTIRRYPCLVPKWVYELDHKNLMSYSALSSRIVLNKIMNINRRVFTRMFCIIRKWAEKCHVLGNKVNLLPTISLLIMVAYVFLEYKINDWKRGVCAFFTHYAVKQNYNEPIKLNSCYLRMQDFHILSANETLRKSLLNDANISFIVVSPTFPYANTAYRLGIYGSIHFILQVREAHMTILERDMTSRIEEIPVITNKFNAVFGIKCKSDLHHSFVLSKLTYLIDPIILQESANIRFFLLSTVPLCNDPHETSPCCFRFGIKLAPTIEKSCIIKKLTSNIHSRQVNLDCFVKKWMDKYRLHDKIELVTDKVAR